METACVPEPLFEVHDDSSFFDIWDGVPLAAKSLYVFAQGLVFPLIHPIEIPFGTRSVACRLEVVDELPT